MKLVPASGGVFEISVDGKRIFSKRETGEFPDFDAIVKTIRAML